jgi:hypothetical protein
MSGIVLDHGDVEVEASIIAEGLRLAPALVQPLLRAGRIASRLECGVDEDAGRHRLTFIHGRRQMQLVVDEAGHVVEQSATELTRPPRRSRPRRRSLATPPPGRSP